MISSWRVSHFKSVYESTELEFAPLTVFSGINNSGKSTIIQSILLTAQTLANPMRNRAVSLNGNFARLGTFNDIISNGLEGEPIDLGFRLIRIDESDLRTASAMRSGFLYHWGSSSDLSFIESGFSFSAKSPGGERGEILQLQPVLESSRIRLGYRGEDGSEVDEEFEFRRRPTHPLTIVKEFELASIDEDDLNEMQFVVSKMPSGSVPDYQPYLSRGQVIGARFEHFVPTAILARYDLIEEESKFVVAALLQRVEYSPVSSRSEDLFGKLPRQFGDIVYQACEEVMESASPRFLYPLSRVQTAFEEVKRTLNPATFRKFASTLLPSARSAFLQKLAEQSETLERIARNGRAPTYRTRYQGLSSRFDFATQYISSYLGSLVKYLAPLRDEPKPIYPLAAATDPENIGLHGEHTAAVLELNKDRIVEYIPSDKFSKDSVGNEPQKAELATAVLDWMRYMGVVTNITTHDLGNRGHELKVATGNLANLRDLTHVGVGVSQVLPIVVLCLLSPRSSILIFEQPELHLHPRVQSRLADFFLSMTFLGKQCVVETHSEHLINRLRLRTAAAPGEEISNRVMMYFVEARDGKSAYRPVRISPFGTIQNWPAGFFDEGEELSAEILKAGMKKRKSGVRGA